MVLTITVLVLKNLQGFGHGLVGNGFNYITAWPFKPTALPPALLPVFRFLPKVIGIYFVYG